MKKNSFYPIINILCVLAILSGLIVASPTEPAEAATTFTVEPYTWNVIGLDSNDPSVGPNRFPVGVEICNTGLEASSTLTVDFVWDSANTYINLQNGISNPNIIPTLAAGNCTDAYFTVEVTRNSAAYEATRRYHITVTESGGDTHSTPQPRELYVERLISQSRNGQMGIEWSDVGMVGPFTPVVPGQTFSLAVGETYWVKLIAGTATNGYEQIESYIDLPNYIFQILDVDTTYTTDPGTFDMLYGDGCGWDDDPNSLNYRSCTGTGKYGGDITVTYEVKILAKTSDNPSPINGMIYDFSGSSYHYNADYGSETTNLWVYDPNGLEFTKSFDQATIAPNGTSPLTFRVTNPNPTAVADVDFTDTFPTGISVAEPGTISYSGCGSVYSPAAVTLGDTSITISDLAIAGYSTCTITLPNLTASAVGSYVNTTDPLIINGTVTDITATDTLTVALNPDNCHTEILAEWTVDGAAVPPDNGTGIATTRGSRVTSAVASYLNNGAISNGVLFPYLGYTYWEGPGKWGKLAPLANSYFQFAVDTTYYRDITISFDSLYMSSGTGNEKNPDSVNVVYALNGSAVENALGTYTYSPVNTRQRYTSNTLTGYPASQGITSFRLKFWGAGNEGNDTTTVVDNIVVLGTICNAPAPTITKNFNPDPILPPGTSVLTFTVSNPGTYPASMPLTGITFTDTLPYGINLTGAVSGNCGTGSTVTANVATRTVTLSGGSLATGGSCTFSVGVVGVAPGAYLNISDRISSIESGINLGPNGYATDTVTVLALPPSIYKSFGDSSVLAGETTRLTLMVNNPDVAQPYEGISFIDTLPTGMTVAVPSNLQENCDGAIVASGSTISLTGASLAPQAYCLIYVDVTVAGGTSPQTLTNTTTLNYLYNSTPVVGNTTTDTLIVRAPSPSLQILKQIQDPVTGNWVNFATDVPVGSTVNYRFIVENTGDMQLTSIRIDDPNVTNIICPVTPLPVMDGLDEEHIMICTGSTTAVLGVNENIAHAHGTAAAEIQSNSDNAWYSTPANYGHLPYETFPTMNLYFEGGARHLTNADPATGAYLGATVPVERDGSPSVAYSTEATDDGLTFAGPWVIGTGGGYLEVSVFCPEAPCYLSGWMDFESSDGGSLVQIINNQPVTTGVHPFPFDIPADAADDLSSGTFYARFRLYSSNPGTALPNGQALSGTTPTWGEVEDYRIDLTGGDPTPVTVAYFLAERTGRDVTFTWTTATESGNVGFNLYVDNGSGRTRINRELIGSQVVDSLNRQDYTFKASISGSIFYIEDVSITGETRLHGPFEAGIEYGGNAEENRIDWEQIHQEREANRASTQETLVPGLISTNAAQAPTAALNFTVSKTGLYRITFEMLRDAGYDLSGVPMAGISLTNRGQVVPITLAGASTFGPGAYIEFYGQALDTIYNDTNVYTLQTNAARHRLIPYSTKVPSRGIVMPGSYMETLVVNKQLKYSEFSPNDDLWYDTAMLTYTTSKSWNFPFTISDLASANLPASLSVTVWGITDWPDNPDHHIQVKVNGTLLAERTFDGLSEQVFSISLPAGLLVEGTNTLTLTLPGDTGVGYDLINLDKYSISYPRVFKAQEGALTFTSAAKAFQVTNLPSKDVVVYRMSATGLTRLAYTIVGSPNNAYTIRFLGDSLNSTYYVSTIRALNKPGFEVVPTAVDLNQPAELLIISHPDFITGLQPLVDARSQQFTVSVVDVTDIYTEYSYGIFDPQAIKTYIQYAAESLGTQYVLLVGGDTYDYRDYLGIGSISFIPSLYASTGPIAKHVPVDPLYTDFNGDLVPDLAIGRFPVRTAAQLNLMVQKTLAYDTKDYGLTAAFASDTRFKRISESLSATLPEGWTVDNIHLDDLDVATARTQLIAAMNEGTALVNYTGHSEPGEWSFSALFNKTHAAALTNHNRPFVVVQWGCWNTYFVDPVYNYLVQSFLFSGDQGAAVVLGATTLANDQSEQMLGTLLMPRLAIPGMTIGQAVQDAKAELGSTHPELLDVLLGWSLMGDPTLIIVP